VLSGSTPEHGLKLRPNYEDKFKSPASDTLNATNDRFLQLAGAHFKISEQETSATLEQKVAAIGEIVNPMKDPLQKVSEHLHALEVKREVAYGEQTKIADLSMRGTQHLVQALQSPTVRGEWGEMQLRRILEMTGMTEYTRDFKAQYHIDSDEGRLIPDFVVNLPGDRAVAFDSKAPMG
jgi:DNA recombination protein RmuC